MRRIFFSNLISFILVFSFTSLTVFSSQYTESGGWKAGVAKVVITPEEPIWMAGYGSRDHQSEGTLVDLWAKALVIEDAKGNRAVLVTTDLIGFRGSYMSGRIREKLRGKYGLNDSQIILSSSHTHTGPELMRAPEDYLGREDPAGPYSPEQRDIIIKYSEKLENKIVGVVGEAIGSMETASLFSGQGVARFAVNRRNHRSKTTVNELSTELDGPVDHSVPVIKVQNSSGEMLAIVFGYACHSTTLSFYKFSGDYAGFAQIELEETYPGATAMFFAGTGADQNPLPRRTVSYAVQYGKTLAAAVETVVSEPMEELSSELSTAYSKVDLGFNEPPPSKEELLKEIEGARGYPGSAKNLLARIERGESLPESYAYPVQFLRIGEQNLVIMASEVVVDYAIRLKQIFGPDIFVMAYANEGMGYIPSTRVWHEGGYEAENAPGYAEKWAPDVEMKVILEVMKLARQSGVLQY
ncbi:MAG: neutral/alkaline non-lysosomal ceramidase N-terminal domain-containing protein [Prolixibacteraceae bacterium]|nr:neutral/alkaline non-lysosomal ceramidase N-terminal domain-containing protein [Prolixibacteraceae bacterium]